MLLRRLDSAFTVFESVPDRSRMESRIGDGNGVCCSGYHYAVLKGSTSHDGLLRDLVDPGADGPIKGADAFIVTYSPAPGAVGC